MIQDQLKSSTKTSELFINYGRISNKTNDQISRNSQTRHIWGQLSPICPDFKQLCIFGKKHTRRLDIYGFLSSGKKNEKFNKYIFWKKTWKRLFWPILAHFSQNPEEWDSSSKTLNKTFFLDCFLSFMANFRKNLWKPSMKKSPQTYEPKGGQADGQAWFHKT